MENAGEIIVIVDDDITNLTAARNSLAGKYSLATVPSGDKLFQLLEKITPTLILLDVEMPVMDGYDVMEVLQSKEKTAHIPVIFLTARIDPDSEIKGLSLGAVDYICKPFSQELLVKRIDAHISFENQKKELIQYNLSLENEVHKKTRTVLELQSAILKTVAELVECRDVVTGGHIERTQEYLRMLVDLSIRHGIYADELLSWDIDLLVMSSQLHDVGKISIKDSILMKQGKLNDAEFEEMKKHTNYGVDIIRRIERSATENEFLFFAEIMAGSHHEKWNGQGYPHALAGTDIPLQGRLMAMADVYDALTNERPYKKAFSHEKSVKIIREEKGAHFDPLIAEVFLAHEKEFGEIMVRKESVTRNSGKLRLINAPPISTAAANGGRINMYAEKIHQYLSIAIKNSKRWMMQHEQRYAGKQYSKGNIDAGTTFQNDDAGNRTSGRNAS